MSLYRRTILQDFLDEQKPLSFQTYLIPACYYFCTKIYQMKIVKTALNKAQEGVQQDL